MTRGKILIIAEAGVNHNGDIGRAKEMILVAKECGADYVKFQTYQSEKLVSRSATKADYQKTNTGTDESQFEMLKKLELSPDDHKVLMEECEKTGVRFLSTAFDLESLDFLKGLGIGVWKIPSGEITNLPYLRKIGSFGDEVILSTGMSDMEEIGAALRVLNESGTKRDRITVLHCSTEYPAPPEEANLLAMGSIGEKYHVKTGYSDHTSGIEVAIAAAALGASVIEKHFTLDKNLPGPDHRASLEPAELKQLIAAVRKIEAAMGDGIKKCSPSEMKNRLVARKSIVASRSIRRGEKFTDQNITAKRPANGISPMEWDRVIGKKAARNFAEDELIEL